MWYYFGKSHSCVLLSWSSVVQNDESLLLFYVNELGGSHDV